MKEFGFVPVIAHPERYVWLSHEELTEFCKQGALLQINYPSLCGRYGEEIKQRASWDHYGWIRFVLRYRFAFGGLRKLP